MTSDIWPRSPLCHMSLDSDAGEHQRKAQEQGNHGSGESPRCGRDWVCGSPKLGAASLGGAVVPAWTHPPPGARVTSPVRIAFVLANGKTRSHLRTSDCSSGKLEDSKSAPHVTREPAFLPQVLACRPRRHPWSSCRPGPRGLLGGPPEGRAAPCSHSAFVGEGCCLRATKQVALKGTFVG